MKDIINIDLLNKITENIKSLNALNNYRNIYNNNIENIKNILPGLYKWIKRQPKK